MNRRNWLKNTSLGTTTFAFSSYIPHVIYSERKDNLTDDNLLRLNWNENAYGPSKKALKAVSQKLSDVNRYPDDQIEILVKNIEDRYAVQSGEVMLTPGSTELLSLLGQQVGNNGGEILMSASSFPTIAIFGERCGASIRTIPLNKHQQIDLERLSDSIQSDTNLIFICNPNNPTSTDHAKSDLIAFCASVPDDVIICIDEAYIQYSRHGEKGSMADQLSSYSNLIILRTFSKAYGLAGMRQGYALGQKELLDRLRQRHLGLGFSNSRAGVVMAIEALKDDDHIHDIVSKNESGRAILYEAFDQWGTVYAPSATNFVYLESTRFRADIVQQLRKENILITKWPSMTNHLRVSIGKIEWMKQFVSAAEKYLI